MDVEAPASQPPGGAAAAAILPPTTLRLDGETYDVLKLGVGYYSRAFTKKYVEENKVTWSDLTVAAKGLDSPAPSFVHVCYSVLLTEQAPLTDSLLQQIEANSQVDATDIASSPDNNKTVVHYKGRNVQVPWKPETFKPASKKKAMKRKERDADAADGVSKQPRTVAASNTQKDALSVKKHRRKAPAVAKKPLEPLFLHTPVLQQYLSRTGQAIALTGDSSSEKANVFPLSRGANQWLCDPPAGADMTPRVLQTTNAANAADVVATPKELFAAPVAGQRGGAAPSPLVAPHSAPVTQSAPVPPRPAAKERTAAKGHISRAAVSNLSVDSRGGGAATARAAAALVQPDFVPPPAPLPVQASALAAAPALVVAVPPAPALVQPPLPLRAEDLSPERALLLMLADMPTIPAYVHTLIKHVLRY